VASPRTASTRLEHANVPPRELHALSCVPFEAAGKPTVRTKARNTVLDEGYYHGLGHGVGTAHVAASVPDALRARC